MTKHRKKPQTPVRVPPRLLERLRRQILQAAERAAPPGVSPVEYLAGILDGRYPKLGEEDLGDPSVFEAVRAILDENHNGRGTK